MTYSKTKVVPIAKGKPEKKKVLFVRSKKESVSYWFQFIQLWKKFLFETTIDGLYLLGNRKVSQEAKFNIFLFWLIALSLSLVLCYQKIVIYLMYDVRVTTTYNTVQEHQFPAISFCNPYFIQRSKAGLSEDFMDRMSKLFARNTEEAISLALQNRKTCKYDYNETAETMEMKNYLYSLLLKSDVKNAIRIYAIDSTMSVQKCWWNDIEINCQMHFMNHEIDDRLCFTFNQDPKLLTVVNDIFPTFGPNIYQTQNLYTSNTGRKNGLKLLINANQNESCGSFEIRYGAGFSVFIHDPLSQTSLQVQSMISLSPGYEYDVLLRPTLYDQRNFSESLGKCTSDVYNFLNPSSSYNQEACIQTCLFESIWTSCNCLMMQKSDLTDSILQHISLPTNNSIKFCNFLDLAQGLCVSDQINVFEASNPDILCPHCKRKCLETKYDCKVSMKKLSTLDVHQLSSEVVSTNESVKKNFLLVSFYFESMELISVRETQKITAVDLFVDISNILGLFLGVSVVTMPEMLFFIYLSVILFCKMVYKRNSVNTIQRRQLGK